MDSKPFPLDGLTIVTAAENYPGPFGTMILSDLGAKVINIERPSGDPARQFKSLYAGLNRGKQQLVIDLKSDDGKSKLRSLLETADVFIEGFRVGVMDRLGFGWDDARSINTRLIYVSITGFGQNGPLRGRPAHDLSCQGIGGMLFRQARSRQPEAYGDVCSSDLAAGLYAAVAILAAVNGREKTGVGTHVDISMSDCVVAMMTIYLTGTLNSKPLHTSVDREPGEANFVCKDSKLLTLSVAHEDHFWKKLCKVLGMKEFSQMSHRARASDDGTLRDRIAESVRGRSRDEWLSIFDSAGIPSGPLHDLEDVVQEPQFNERGLFVHSASRLAPDYEGFVRTPIFYSTYSVREDFDDDGPQAGE